MAGRAGVLGLVVAVLLIVVAVSGSAGAAGLPDGRGYELASPGAKNGNDVMAASTRVRVAADGNAVTFASLGGFGDVQGAGVGFDYITQRTGVSGTSGWVSHPLNPRQPASMLIAPLNAGDSYYEGDFTPDLRCGVYAAVRPLPGVGNPADTPNLYRLDDLRKPGAGSYALLTVPLVPVAPAFVVPRLVAVSEDCSHVLYDSSLNLVPEASGSGPKLYEWVDGTLRLAGILPDGSPAPDSVSGLGGYHYMLGMLSADGSRVFFSVPSTGNVYMRVDGTSTVRLNTAVPSAQPLLQVVSADNRYAFMATGSDLYRVDVTAPSDPPTLITVDGVGAGHAFNGVLGVSTDGSYVYFFAAGQLVPGEPQLRASGLGLYAWHDGTVRFIGETAGLTDTIPNSLDTDPGFEPLLSRVSPAGSRLLVTLRSGDGFRGRWGFPGYDHSHRCNGTLRCREVYVFDADAGSLVCTSCNPSGATATSDALIDARSGIGASNRPLRLSHPFSADGRRVFFHTAEALVPEDSNGHLDVYEYDVDNARVHLISSGKDPSDSFFMEASPNGDDVFFATRQRLVGWDIDQNYDLYDARVGGGLPDPAPAQPACAGQSCQAQTSTSPTPGSTGSSTYTGPGDTKPRLKPHHPRNKRQSCRKTRKNRCTRHKRTRHATTHHKNAK